MNFSELFIRRPVLTIVTSILVLLLGIQGFFNMTIREYPEVEESVIAKGTIYYGLDKEKGYAAVTMPLRDRNGDIIAATRVVMKSFVGQTEQNALARATPLSRRSSDFA